MSQQRTVVRHSFRDPDNPATAVVHSAHECVCGPMQPRPHETPEEFAAAHAAAVAACCAPFRAAVPTTPEAKRAFIAANPNAPRITLSTADDALAAQAVSDSNP